MRWFSGNMLQAIAEAHSRRVLLLVFIEGDDLASQNMRSTFDDAEVNKLIDVMGCVPIRLRANSNACRQFTLVYPVTAIPSTFFISSRGNLEASIVGFTDPVLFGDRLAALMASCNLKKVDSEMRNTSEASLSVDRMMRLNRQSSTARLPTSAEGGPGPLSLQPPPTEGAIKKRSKGGERRSKKRLRRQEANVQTSIVVLAEQATQINMDDKRSYNSLLQKLAAMEETTSVPTATVATAKVHGELAGDLASLMGDGKEKRDLGVPQESEGALAGGADVDQKGKPLTGNKSERAVDNGANDQARPGSHKTKGDDEINASMPPPPPPPPPPPAAEAVRANEDQGPVNDAPPVALEDADSILCDVIADGPGLLIKFAVLAQEFADKVLGSSQHEHTDGKSPEASAAETPKADVRRPAVSSHRPKAKQEAAKSETSPPAKTVEVHAMKDRQRQPADSFKRSCQLESLQANVGDAPKAIATLQEEEALEQVGDKDTSADKRRRSSGTRSHKQQRNSDASLQLPPQQAKHGSEKRKKRRDSSTRDHTGDSKKTTTSSKKVAAKAAAAPGSSTQEPDNNLGQLALKIKHFESAAGGASQDPKVLSEKKAKRPKSASPSKPPPPPPPPANDTRARSPENNGSPRTLMSSAPPPLPTVSLEQEVCVVRMRPGIDTITEEETGAIESGLTTPQPTPPPPPPLPPTPEVPTQPEVQKVLEETSHKSAMKEAACDTMPAPLSGSQPPSQQTTQATTAQNRKSHQSRKSARRPSSPNRSKEFLTASNSQLEDPLVFGLMHRTSDDSAAAASKRAPPSHSRPRGDRRVATAARSPPYERLVDSDGDDETVDDELMARRTPSAFRVEADWMDEMARTASRRTLLYRAGALEESLNNLFRTLNDMEGPTLSLSVGGQSRTNVIKAQAKAAQDDGAVSAPPAGSPSKQHVHVAISDHKADGVEDDDEAKVNAVGTAAASTKTTHRVSLSGTNVRNLSRSRPSASRLGVSGGRSPSAETSQTSGVGNNARRSASFTPLAIRGCGGAACGADKASIVLNLPDGSSVLRSFPASAYLDEVRWYTEELLARVIPSCFPFTMARTNPLREFSREDYRKTLEQLRLVPSAALLVLPRSAAMGESGAPPLLPSGANGDPFWFSIFRLVFGMFVATPLALFWNLVCPENEPSVAAAREAFLSGSLGSSTLSALPRSGVATVATPLRSASSSRLCRRRQSSRTENFDLF